MSRKKKTAIILAGLLLVYALAGFIIIPLVLESILPDKLHETLHRPVAVENIRLNPFAPPDSRSGRPGHQGQKRIRSICAFDELFVNIQTLSLFKLGFWWPKKCGWSGRTFTLCEPVRLSLIFSDLLPEKRSERAAGTPGRISER
ncbi:MAG: hypothetical protein R2860_17210 [Desulfobacterales bacterium]